MTKTIHSARKWAYLAAAVLALALVSLFMPAASAANGGLVGANIKDGVLLGYYGNGGDIEIPNTVTQIGAEAFKGNDNVTSITIPGSVREIGYSAFEGCTELKSVIFSDPVDGANLTIRVSAFIQCPKLETCEIPACAVYVTGNVFKGCSSMEKIQVHPQNPYYYTDDYGVMFGPWVDEGEPQYDDPNNALISYPAGRQAGGYTIPSEVKGHPINRLWAGSFRMAKNLTDIEIPATCTILGGNAFEETGLTEVVIPDTVKTIGMGLFESCADLTDVTLPQGLTEVPFMCFMNCTSLQRVNMPDSITSFDTYAFAGCTSLSSMVLPRNLTALKIGVLEGCTNLQRVVIPPSVISFPVDNEVGSLDPFKNCASDLIVYVQEGSNAHKWLVNYGDYLGLSYQVANVQNPETIDAGEFSLVDMGNKIKVSGAFQIGSSIKAQKLAGGSAYDAFAAAADGKKMTAYQIDLLPNGAKTPDSMSMQIGLDTSFTSNTKLYTLENGAVTAWNSSVSGRTLRANIEELGAFAVIDNQSVPSEDNDKPASITLSTNAATLEAGKKLQLSATVLPNTAVDKSVTWTSSDDAVASVTNKGVVTAVKAGSATITAKTVNGLTATCAITVTGGTAPDPTPTPDEQKVTASAALRAGTSRTDDGKASFHLALKDAQRVATVEVTFTASSEEVSVSGQNGFSLLGSVNGSVSNGTYTGKAMLVYLSNNQQTFSCTNETAIAQLAASGDKPAVTITSMTISGWDDDQNVKFGTVEGIDPAEAIFTGEKNYDVNGDGVVDQLDITTAQLYYRVTSADSKWSEASKCDFNDDNVIDVADYVEILLHMTNK